MNNMINWRIRGTLARAGMFQKRGTYVMVDGQFGSTGKGLAASVLAENMGELVENVLSNAGPNSGHTSFFEDEKIVLKQLPSFSVTAKKMGLSPLVFMDAGAVIDIDILNAEMAQYGLNDNVFVHPHASVISPETVADDAASIESIGSTGKGTGPAQVKKIQRREDAVVAGHASLIQAKVGGYTPHPTHMNFIEVSQGFSLGINSGFYPYTTSRECTVMQALSDANIHPEMYCGSIMVVRTFPIRVAGNSGPCYPDQQELTWEDLGVEPEITTVTKKIRRVFSWSDIQFCQALEANRPDVVFVNFCNYLQNLGADVEAFVLEHIYANYVKVMGRMPKAVLLGFGPKTSDVKVFEMP
jgi:adenylosuccinate synthase